MKKVNESEKRMVNGSYRVKCTYCDKKSGSTSSWGVTSFYIKHHHWSGGYVVWDFSFRNADKWYS